MKSKFIAFLLSAALLALVCIYAFAQTNKKEQKPNTSNTAIVEVQTSEQDSTRPNYKPKDGYVPDEQTAIAIAVAVWNPIYGKEKIEGEKPYQATLKNGVWTVTGSLPKGYDKGGTAIADISKDDGRILRVIHEK